MTGRCIFSSMANSTLIANYNEANSSTIATCLLNTWVQAKRHAIYMIQIPESDLSGKNYDLNRCVSNKHGNYSKSSFHSSLNQHTTYHWSASNLLEQKKASYSFSINWTHFDCTLILNELNTIPNISRHIIQQQSKSLWLPRKKMICRRLLFLRCLPIRHAHSLNSSSSLYFIFCELFCLLLPY